MIRNPNFWYGEAFRKQTLMFMEGISAVDEKALCFSVFHQHDMLWVRIKRQAITFPAFLSGIRNSLDLCMVHNLYCTFEHIKSMFSLLRWGGGLNALHHPVMIFQWHLQECFISYSIANWGVIDFTERCLKKKNISLLQTFSFPQCTPDWSYSGGDEQLPWVKEKNPPDFMGCANTFACSTS